MWSDPQNSFLMPFWVHVLGCNAAVVFVHRGPTAIVSSLAFRNPTRAEVLDQWDRYNRIAMVHCSEWPAFVMSYEGVVESPKATILELGGFLEECGISLVKTRRVLSISSREFPMIGRRTEQPRNRRTISGSCGGARAT